MDGLPEDEYRNEPGVVLVDRYAALRAEKDRVEGDIERVKEALLDYARREQLEVVWGSDHKASLVFEEKLRFPGKGDVGRKEPEVVLKGVGMWDKVSELSTASLVRAIEDGLWERHLIEEVMKYGRFGERSSVRLSRLQDERR